MQNVPSQNTRCCCNESTVFKTTKILTVIIILDVKRKVIVSVRPATKWMSRLILYNANKPLDGWLLYNDRYTFIMLLKELFLVLEALR